MTEEQLGNLMSKFVDAEKALAKKPHNPIAARQVRRRNLDALYRFERTTVTQILKDACARSGVSSEDVLGKTRKSEIVKIRHKIMKLAFDSGVSLSGIGRQMKRDHSTVLHAINKSSRNAA